MPARTVEIFAPSRLHFGLFSFGSDSNATERQYGGVGAMVEKPGLALRLNSAAKFEVAGPLSQRVSEFADRWARFHQTTVPACRIEVLRAPADHVGLGTGTQLGLAVAAALDAFEGRPPATPTELALSVGCAGRSAVGTYGFLGGGLIVERGKLASELISPLDCRLDLPSDWRFVLITPSGLIGKSGEDEASTFSQLPQVAPETSSKLVAMVRDRLLPAAARGDFATFSESLYDFGHAAGLCFAASQGGAYNGPQLTELVATIRRLGVRGVGQSSWGPTIFALLPSEPAAQEFVVQLQSQSPLAQNVVVTPVCNTGAKIKVG